MTNLPGVTRAKRKGKAQQKLKTFATKFHDYISGLSITGPERLDHISDHSSLRVSAQSSQDKVKSR